MSIAESSGLEAAQSRSDEIYRTLHQAITEQALRPGTKLPEDAIGRHFGVSRTVVRAAITRLRSHGLVAVQRNRGAAVAIPSLEQAQQVFMVRRCLEREIVRILADGISLRQLELLEQHVLRETEAHIDGTDPHASIRLTGEFHVLLASMSGNEVMHSFIDDLVARSSLILAVHGRPHSADCAVSEHRQVIAALRAGDAERAIAVMDGHLQAVESRAYQTPARSSRSIGEILRRYSNVRSMETTA
jgi:DNA-binding GntR family transcriptional regulator